jgi:UDP-N-acetylmuramoylalanine--D-glutamate ligase
MKIAIVGFDTEGRATYDYLKQLGGQEITICDQNERLEVPEGVATRLGDGYLNRLNEFDAIVRTAGLHPAKILAQNPGVEERITTHTNLFFGATPTWNIIGVTGTKGKGTTSTLITKMLEAAGRNVRLGGNIGVPPLTFLSDLDKESWVVLELSSFQLIDLRYSPTFAVCLMVVPEHLDWHKDMAEYVSAKEQLFAHQQADDTAVYFANNDLSYQIASAGLGEEVPYYDVPGAIVENEAISIENQVICELADLKLLGQHNWQNACAAVTAVWRAGVTDPEPLREVLTTFNGLEHRLEHVREIDEVAYYDDSFGTTPETAIVAIQAFEQPKVIVLGGSDKGVSYDELAKTVSAANIRKVLLIGEQAGRIQEALEKTGFADFVPGGENMTDIVSTARSHAQPGDVVLLSTACASFDMFKNYKDRGDQFKSAVQALR